MSYLKNFKKVGCTDTHTIMRHPNGHEIHIAHAKLDKKMKAQMDSLPIKKYSSGGDVQPVIGQDAEGQATFDLPGALQQLQGAASNLTTPIPGHLGTGTLAQPEGTAGWTPAKPIDQPAPASEPAAPAPTDSPTAPQAPQLPQDPYGMAAMEQSYTGGIGEMAKGIRGEAAAKSQQGQGELAALNVAHDRISKAMSDAQAHYTELETERQQWRDDLAKGQINPNHYWESKDTSGKILTGIGILLGGLGGGIAHTGKNAVMDFISQQIDRDIDAQKANIGTKKTLLEANLRQFGNLRDATEMTRVMLKDAVGVDMAKAAAKASSPMAQATAQEALGKLHMETAPVLQGLAMRKAMMGMQQGGQMSPEQYLQAMRVMDPKMAQEMEGRFVPGMGFASVPVTDKVRGEIVGRQELDQKLARLERFAQENQGNLNPAVSAQGKALAQDAQDAYRRANGQGVFREGEAKFVNGMIDMDPTKFFSAFRTMPGYKAVRQGNTTALQTLLRNYGLRQPSISFTKAQ